jgi:hypothetical protein
MWTEVYLVELLETPHRASRPMGEDVVAIAGEPHAGYHDGTHDCAQERGLVAHLAAVLPQI